MKLQESLDMKFTQTLVYSGSRAQVTEMLKNPEYYKKRWAALDDCAQVDLSLTENRIRVSSTVSVSAENLEQLANKLNSGLNLKVVEVWDLNQPGWVENGTMSGSMAGVPVKFSATMVANSGSIPQSDTEITLEGEVTCAIPFFAAGVERAVIKTIQNAFAKETAKADEFLL
ncbi:DUF2505 domain-containing protein [Mobiluncus curtisii]|uniref:DUF2505 domain-containing protein n=2 Tax=Mobiluncus curtisii TaxID=2051 RepID=UPI001470014E|nr:DUF2505 domain-containing protein [Mobiluncus curtisii]NMW44445.1 DUF2505 domain-containing protein [Mobiluncus curtisii]NMW82889.1 DUF2505 domain-containing protein [Mobiluncus curtisii]NMW98484.1 DUF2505 domain-containing protein [Mobiluncus curtisii]NMX06172.1 DUF2505 domain-containing protein [Mobiluncus curtisii]